MLNGGVGNYGNARRHYWYSDSLKAWPASDIDTAVGYWIYTTNNPPYVTTPISWRCTTTKSDAHMEFHIKTGIDQNVLGRTYWMLYQQNVTPTNQNWGWAKIELDYTLLTEAYGQENYWHQRTIAHKIGHAFGLCHVQQPYRIMCTDANGGNGNRPASDDCQTINHLYK